MPAPSTVRPDPDARQIAHDAIREHLTDALETTVDAASRAYAREEDSHEAIRIGMHDLIGRELIDLAATQYRALPHGRGSGIRAKGRKIGQMVGMLPEGVAKRYAPKGDAA